MYPVTNMARPNVSPSGEPLSALVQVRVTEVEHREIHRLAAKRGVGVAALTREALSFYTAAMRSGAVPESAVVTFLNDACRDAGVSVPQAIRFLGGLAGSVERASGGAKKSRRRRTP